MNAAFPFGRRTGAADARPVPGHTARRDELKLALATIGLFWSAYFLIATAKSLIAMVPDPGTMLLRRTLVTVMAMGLTLCLWALLHRLRERPVPQQALMAFGASVPLAFTYAFVNYIAFYQFPLSAHAGRGLFDQADGPAHAFTAIVWTVLDWYFFICCWAVLWIALAAGRRAQDADERARRLERLANEAQLTALRYQINPHFLFNALNSLSLLVMKGMAAQAERMITGLADFLRATLKLDPTLDVPLSSELALQRKYLEIEAVRFPGRLEVEVACQPEAAAAGVPPLILQPLVENAIKHGVSSAPGRVCLTIRAEARAGRLLVEVVNDCPAVPAARQEGCGVGLANVAARLEARHGADAWLESGFDDQPQGLRWRAAIALPRVESGGP